MADRFVYPLVGVGGFGFLELLTKLPRLWKIKRQILDLLKTDAPDLVIPIDYYGFNIHVAEAARDLSIPVIYYISPQVWASRAGRVQRLAKAIRRMLVILPFEEELYAKAGIPVTYVGHPLVERLPNPATFADQMRIGFLPGSRRGVIARHLPIVAGTADRLHAQFPKAEVFIFKPDEISSASYSSVMAKRPWITLSVDSGYEIRKSLTLAIGVSGTAALENMLLGIPMIIMYRLSWATYAIARKLIRVPFVGMPNLLAGKALVPELLQQDATPQQLTEAAAALLNDGNRRSAMRSELLALRAIS